MSLQPAAAALSDDDLLEQFDRYRVRNLRTCNEPEIAWYYALLDEMNARTQTTTTNP